MCEKDIENIESIDEAMLQIAHLIKHLRVGPTLNRYGMIDYQQINERILYIRSLCERQPTLLTIAEINDAINDFKLKAINLDTIFGAMNDLKIEDENRNGKKYQSWMEILFHHYFVNSTQEELAEQLEIGRATLNRRKKVAEKELMIILIQNWDMK